MHAQAKLQSYHMADQEVSTSEALQRVVTELHELTATTTRIQTLVSDLISQSDEISRDNVYSIQELDRLTQTLDNLTSFLSYISENTNSESHINIMDAVKLIKLSALASNLINGAQQIEIEDAEDDDDDCEFF